MGINKKRDGFIVLSIINNTDFDFVIPVSFCVDKSLTFGENCSSIIENNFMVSMQPDMFVKIFEIIQKESGRIIHVMKNANILDDNLSSTLMLQSKIFLNSVKNISLGFELDDYCYEAVFRISKIPNIKGGRIYV